METFAKLMSGMMRCQNCGSEVFYDVQKEENGVAHTCWGCQKAVTVPPRMVIGKNTGLLMSNTKLYQHHIAANDDI